ncbi:hypothetical protein FRB99_002218, partial [Tulasnella sp. 403]
QPSDLHSHNTVQPAPVLHAAPYPRPIPRVRFDIPDSPTNYIKTALGLGEVATTTVTEHAPRLVVQPVSFTVPRPKKPSVQPTGGVVEGVSTRTNQTAKACSPEPASPAVSYVSAEENLPANRAYYEDSELEVVPDSQASPPISSDVQQLPDYYPNSPSEHRQAVEVLQLVATPPLLPHSAPLPVSALGETQNSTEASPRVWLQFMPGLGHAPWTRFEQGCAEQLRSLYPQAFQQDVEHASNNSENDVSMESL